MALKLEQLSATPCALREIARRDAGTTPQGVTPAVHKEAVMADDPKPEPDPKKADPEPDPDAGAKKALDAERTARREAERQLKEVQAQLKDLADKDKSEVDKLRDEVAALTKERDEHASKVLRSEIAMSKGLTAAQAKRLVGTTKEELEADADEILEAFPAAGGATPPPTNKPKPDLKGGSEPNTEPTETNPAKLAETVPRY